MVARAQVHSAFWFDHDEQDRFLARLGRTLTISLVLHLIALLIAMGIRLTPHGERPLASVQVNLVSLPTPVNPVEQSRPVDPVKRVEPKPVPVSAPHARVPAPAAAPVSTPARVSVAKDILKDLELPPDAPKFGELTPVKSVAQPRPQVQAKVHVPDLPRIPVIDQVRRRVSLAWAGGRARAGERGEREDQSRARGAAPHAGNRTTYRRSPCA